jgi:hypothetical protein
VTLTDAGLYPLPENFPLWPEALRPADWTPGDFFPGAPPGPYAAVSMTSWNGLAANGTWSLYVYDGQFGNQGGIAGGWSLLIGTSTGAVPGPVTLTSIEQHEGGRVRIKGSGDGGLLYSMQASTDLVHWETIGTITAAANGAFEFEDANVNTLRGRFYRAILP